MSSNAAITDDFINAWNALDVDAVMSFFTEDAEYANVPMGPPNVGVEAIRAFIDGFMGMTTEINFVVHNQVEGANGVVMNERTDSLVMNGNRVDLPVMGVFEFENGKIKAWRDYFDMSAFAGDS
jgi:limonene-1,2-epoxide hydrolase